MPHKFTHIVQYSSAPAETETACFIGKENTGLIMVAAVVFGEFDILLVDWLVIAVWSVRFSQCIAVAVNDFRIGPFTPIHAFFDTGSFKRFE
jgi:hypothetical protein